MKLIFIVILGFCSIALQAQETITAAGSNNTGTGGSISLTAGQTVYITITGSEGTVSPGVQQPYEISVVTGNENAGNFSLSWSVYPNPANEFLKVTLLHDSENADLKPETLTLRLYDLSGRLLLEKNLDGYETTISMSGFIPATYLLSIVTRSSTIKRELITFKVIKNP